MKGVEVQALILDALQNIETGLGIPGMDKSTYARFVETELTYGELENAYSSDWLTGKVCDVPPFDMTREWRKFDGSIDPNKLTEFKTAEDKFNIRDKIKESLVYSRIYGGAGIVINADDGNEPWEPLNIENIKKDGLRWLHVSDSQYLKPRIYSQDPFSTNYGYPEFYSMAPSSIYIHFSRIIRFEGIPLPLAARRRNNYWGKSIIERLYNALKNASSSQDNVNNLIYEASVDIVKIPEFMEMASSSEGEDILRKRFAVAKLQKSVNRMLILDADEEYETHQQNLAGLRDVMQEYMNIVAGAADIPITRLLGQSPGGLNSTGTSDIRNYYDFIAGQQELILRSKLELIDELIYRSTFGKPPSDGELQFRFNSLWQMNEKEQADLQLIKSQRDSAYLDRGVIGEGVVATELALDDTYSAIDADYISNLDMLPPEGDDFDEDGGFDEDGNSEEGTERYPVGGVKTRKDELDRKDRKIDKKDEERDSGGDRTQIKGEQE